MSFLQQLSAWKALLLGVLCCVLTLSAQASNDWYWDNDAGDSLWHNSMPSTGNWDTNTDPTTVSGVTPDVFFTDDYVSGDQTITVKGSSKTVHTMTFSGQYGYTIKPQGSVNIILDSGVAGGSSYISLLSDVGGDANHSINIDLQANNDLVIQNFASSTLTFKKTIDIGANTLTFDNTGTVVLSSSGNAITGSGDVIKNNTGTVQIRTQSTFNGSLTVNDGTFQLMDTGSLSGVSEIILNGGTLLQDEPDAINTSANLTLAGGTYHLRGDGGQDLNNLTLSDDSTINLQGSNNVLTFSSGTYSGGLLTIDNWDGSYYGGGTDQVVFNSTLSQDFLSNVYWEDEGITGAFQLASGEIVPVPEPETYAAGAVMFLSAIYHAFRRRQRKDAEDPQEGQTQAESTPRLPS